MSTADGTGAGSGIVATATVLELAVAGRLGVPADAASVVLNVTVTEPQAAGFITAYPCGAERPTASNLNFVTGQTIANMVIARIGPGGRVCLYTSSAAHLVVDIAGWFPTNSYAPMPAPQRVADTRPASVTADGAVAAGGMVPAGGVLELPVAGRVGIPATASSIALNVTVTEPAGAGFITVYPCGEARPTASSLNFVGGQTIANTVVARASTTGAICLYASNATHLIVDATGWFPYQAPPTTTPTTPTTPTTVLAPDIGWLEVMNKYRVESGLNPVVNEPAWTAGASKHLAYLKNTPADLRTGADASAHAENPASA